MEVSEISVKKVNRQEVLKYLGFRGHEIPSDVDSLIYECIEDIKSFSKPKYIYQIFEIDREKTSKHRDRVFLKDTDFVLIGNDINEMLSECDKCILMAVTLGVVVDNKIRVQQIRDLTKSIILDSCASSAIESVCNEINERIEKEYNAIGLFLTDRFSPGYGDMPISQQPDFLRVLDAQRKIGLNVSSSGIMIPRKSVTAIIGISNKKQLKRFAGCENCKMFMNCEYRKSGISCGRF